jgi:MFS family permease
MAILSGARAAQVFLCLAAAYLLSYAFRAINAVIAPALTEDVGLSNADLGLLSSAYFVAFAGMQLPLGVWLDKYGARKTETTLLLFAAAGAAIFAMSDTLLGLWIGRALIGVGVSACLMAPFKAYRQWFAPERQSQLMSWMLVAGTSGALTATVPVTAAMPLIGWRGIFWLMAGLILLSAAAIFVLLKDVETQAAAQADPVEASTSAGAGKDGYGRIFGHPYFRRIALLGSVNQGTFIALQTLWAGPWMITVLGMSETQASQILFAFNLCLMLAYLGLGWLAPRYVSDHLPGRLRVARVVTIGLTGTLLAQTAMLFFPAPWSWLLWLLLAVGITVNTLGQSAVSLSFPASLAGRANSAYNLSVFIGAFVAQWGIGLLIDAFEARGASAADAMRATLGIFVVLQTASLVAFAMNRAQPQR